MSKYKLFTFLLIFLSFSAIFSFYNFKSASAYTGTITYNSGTNTITCVGGSSSTPITFSDIYEADTNSSWGVVSTQGNAQFLFNCKITIGDGSTATWFSDTLKQLILNDGVMTAANQDWIKIEANATVNLGILSDNTIKRGSQGCDFLILETTYFLRIIYPISTNATVNLYGCSFRSLTVEAFFQGQQVYNTICNGRAYFVGITNVQSDINNYISASHIPYSTGIRNLISGSTINNLFLQSTRNNIWLQTGVTFSNVKAEGGSYIIAMQNVGSNVYAINTVWDSVWAINWAGTSAGKVYRQYTFNLNVLNGNITDFVQNANVTLYKDNVKIYSALTNSSGMIPTQTLTYGYYQQSTGNTIQNATSPYYLVITHPDWQTYISRFYITEPLRLTVSMQEPTYTGYTEAEKSDYTTIILLVISLILCIIGLALTVPLLPLISLTISVINIIFLSEPSIFNILLIILNVTFTLIALVRAKTKNN